MKITLCTTQKFVPPLAGGVDVYTERLARALERLGHQVMVIALDPTVDTAEGAINVARDEYGGINIWRLEFSFARRPPEAFHLAYDPEMGQAVKNILQEHKPDLFIILNFYMLTLASVEAAKELGIPVVHVATDFLPVCRRGTLIRWNGQSCQAGESIKACSACYVSHHALGRLASSMLGKLPDNTLIQWANTSQARPRFHPLSMLRPYWHQVALMGRRLELLPQLREKIDLVLVPTQYTRKMFLANGFRADQLHFLPFGVDVEHPLTRVKHIPASHTRFLFIGRFQPYKGAHLLIEAFNSLQAPKGATLTLYGGPDGHDAYFDRLKNMMASNDRIRFAGKIAPADLAHAFAEADFFILPSTWHENSPLILLDALQSKTPVIASDIGGVTDVIKDGVNGFLFPMGDKAALRQVMQRVIDQPVLAQQLRPGMRLPAIDDYAGAVIDLCRELALLPQAEEIKSLV